MLSKRKILVSLILVVTLVVGITFAVSFFVKSSAASSVSSNSGVVSQSESIPQNSVQIPVQSLQSGDAQVQVAEASDVSFRLGATQATDTAIQVELCIQLPSTEGWVPEASLIAGGQPIPAQEWGLLNSKDPTTYTSRERCYQFSFPLPAGAQTHATPLRVVVERLFIPLVDTPTEEECAKAQQKLDQASKGIRFTCTFQPGAYGFDISQKPQGMSEEQAVALINVAFRKKAVERAPGSLLYPEYPLSGSIISF